MSGRFAKKGSSEMSALRSGRPSWLVGRHPLRRLCAAQWLSKRQLRNHGPDLDTQSLTPRALSLGTTPARPRRQVNPPPLLSRRVRRSRWNWSAEPLCLSRSILRRRSPICSGRTSGCAYRIHRPRWRSV